MHPFYEETGMAELDIAIKHGQTAPVGQPRQWVLQALDEPAETLQSLSGRRHLPGVLEPLANPVVRDRHRLPGVSEQTTKLPPEEVAYVRAKSNGSTC
jgi:hypothetical protein